jgi:hypothetical protein
MSLLHHLGGLLALVVLFVLRLIQDFGGYETANAADRYLTRRVGPVGVLELLGICVMAESNRHATVY